jgi:hypothetical protein
MSIFTVTTLLDESDSGATVASPGGTGLSLREAIDLANVSAGADTINFAAALSGGTIRLTSALVVLDKLTIDGDNGALDADFPNILITGDVLGNDRLIGSLTDIAASQAAGTLGDNVSIISANAPLTLHGLALTGGVTAGSGGAIYAPAGLTLGGSVVSGNSAGVNGGAIWIGDASANVFSTSLVGNKAGSVGGAIAGIINGAATFSYATISGNSAGGNGGAIALGTASLTNSTVTGNHAANVADGIAATDVTLRNSIVLGNGATNSDEVFGTLHLLGGNIVGTNVYQGTTDIGDTTAADVFLALDSTTGGGRVTYDGGWTPQIDLQDATTNPAIDASDNSVATFWQPFDFAAVPNLNGSPRDLGAFELFPTGGAPKNSLPGPQSVAANADSAITGLFVVDPDPGSGVLTTTLSVLHGRLTVALASGATISGNGTSTVALSGTVSQINAALTAANNVIYHAEHDFFGADTLTMATNDNGTGTSTSHADTDQTAIKINGLLTGTTGNDTFTAPSGSAHIDAGAGIDTIAFGFKLTDATITFAGNEVIVDGPNGSSHTVLTGFEVYKFTDGTVNNSDSDPLIDDLFYYSHYHEIWTANIDADTDYHAAGWKAGRDPDAFFSTATYLSKNADVKAAGIDPLVHFDHFGWSEGRDASVLFDPQKYLAANPDVAAAHVDPLTHFLQFGAGEGRQPIAPDVLLQANGFDYVYYLQHNPDVAAAHVDPFVHYETIGWKEGRNPNAWFDTAGYLAHYADVAAAGVNALDHYNQFGWKEGRDPSVNFDTTDYLQHNPDVAAAHVNPLTHFLQHGQFEGRSSFADGVWG